MNDTHFNPDPAYMAFGRYLKSMRMQMGIPIETVADEIRISIRQLRIIEDEDHAQLPDAVYVKGLLKAYAGFIGVDGDDIVERYTINRSAYDKQQAKDSSFFRYSKKTLSRLGVSAGFLIIIIVLSVYIIYGSQANPLLQSECNRSETSANSTFRADKEIAAGSSEVNPNDRLFLQVDAVEDTALTITVDDAEPMEYVLNPMDHMELEASEKIQMRVGNAAGIKIVLNDKPVVINGKSGETVDIELP